MKYGTKNISKRNLIKYIMKIEKMQNDRNQTKIKRKDKNKITTNKIAFIWKH